MRDQRIENKISGESIRNDDFIMGLSKGLKILEAFGIDRQRLNATQIAARTELSRTAARRYLRTLKFLGYLEGDDHAYSLTHKVLRFSSAYLSSAYLPKISQPILNMLSAQTGMAFSVAVLDEDEVIPVARSMALQPLQLSANPYGIHLGNRLPAHATSTGKVLLAALSEPEQQHWIAKFGLKKLTTFTLQQSDEFLAHLAQIATQGFCLSKEEHELGVIAIAVPIVDTHGNAVAALNCISQTNLVTASHLKQEILAVLLYAAQQIRLLL